MGKKAIQTTEQVGNVQNPPETKGVIEQCARIFARAEQALCEGGDTGRGFQDFQVIQDVVAREARLTDAVLRRWEGRRVCEKPAHSPAKLPVCLPPDALQGASDPSQKLSDAWHREKKHLPRLRPKMPVLRGFRKTRIVVRCLLREFQPRRFRDLSTN